MTGLVIALVDCCWRLPPGPAIATPMAEPNHQEEHLDVLTKSGEKTGVSKPRSSVFWKRDRNTLLSPSHLELLTYTILRKCLLCNCRSLVHRDGDYHRAVHVWIYSESTQELLLQKRADCKASWPGKWDISSAGHISSGESSLLTARYFESWNLYYCVSKFEKSMWTISGVWIKLWLWCFFWRGCNFLLHFY